MMSDEMRELVSSYVDGELRNTDAARVEELSKRDPELRREIEAYKKLRRKLKDWDEADHGHEPPPALRHRALARVRALVDERREERRGRIVAILFSPVAAAAALLLAVGGGLLASWQAPAPTTPVADTELVIAPAAPLPDLTVQGSGIVPYEELAEESVGPGFKEVIQRRMDTWDLMDWMMRDEEGWERYRDKIEQSPERPTRTRPSLDVVALVNGPKPADRPVHALYVLEQPEAVRNLPATIAAPVGQRLAMDQNTTDGRVYIDLRHLDNPILSPLGEVWIGKRDGSGRTRIVSATSWISRGELVPVVWADQIGVPKRSTDLEVQNFVLGPEVRQRLLTAEHADPVFQAWLQKRYGGRTLTDVFARNAKKRDRIVNRLVTSLGRNLKTTGFAVVNAQGKLMGVELFASHALMMKFAPRLLRGYLIEAGRNGVRLTPSSGASVAPLMEFLEGMKQGSSRMEKIEIGSQKEWPKGVGLELVQVRRNGKILAHGMVDGKKHPLHVTIFGE